MEASAYESLVKKAAELFARGTDQKEIITELRNVKQTLTDHIFAINRANNLLDAIQAAVAPDYEWQYAEGQGWTMRLKASAVASAPGVAVGRRARILELAAAAVARGETTIQTKAIAEQLRAEGHTPHVSDLSTAVGNVLSRAEGWRRVAPGEYAYGGQGGT